MGVKDFYSLCSVWIGCGFFENRLAKGILVEIVVVDYGCMAERIYF